MDGGAETGPQGCFQAMACMLLTSCAAPRTAGLVSPSTAVQKLERGGNSSGVRQRALEMRPAER